MKTFGTFLFIIITSSTVFAAPTAIVYPIDEGKISSSYGDRIHPIRKVRRHHSGIDIAAKSGTPVKAITNGIVVFSGELTGFGKTVVVFHRNGITSLYGHLEKINNEAGKSVQPGDIIGLVGQTGLATGPHLHFSLMQNSNSIDPAILFPGFTEDKSRI